jgi:hypothetical protein
MGLSPLEKSKQQKGKWKKLTQRAGNEPGGRSIASTVTIKLRGQATFLQARIGFGRSSFLAAI